MTDFQRTKTTDYTTGWTTLPTAVLPTRFGEDPIFIEFHALRGDGGKYLGCLEFTQDVQAIRDLQGQKRLID